MFDFVNPGSVMHKFVHNLAFAVVLLHMSVGCCWHHAHADDAVHDHQEVDGPCGRDHHQHACHSEHDHSADPGPCCGHQHGVPASGCEDRACVFVVPERPDPVRPAECSAPLAVDTAFVPAMLSPAAGATFSDDLPPPGNTPALRVHLLNQILLI